MLADAVVRIIRWIRTTENVGRVRSGAQCQDEVGSFRYGFAAIVPDFESRALVGRRTGQKWRRRVAHEGALDEFWQIPPIPGPRRHARLVDPGPVRGSGREQSFHLAWKH